MRTFGDPQRFALGFALEPDPDAGGSREDRATWARMQIWVAGRHLTSGRSEEGQSLDAAEVPLAPVLRWLIQNWDALFHEERLPRPSSTTSAAAWRTDSLVNLPDDDTLLDELMEDRDQWWQRHGLGSCLPGFRVPDLHIRRSGQQVEVSWDDSEWRSVPRGVQLVEPPGAVVLPAEEVARTWHAWASAVVEAVARDQELAGFVDTIRKGLERASRPDSLLDRLELAAGQTLFEAAVRRRQEASVREGKGDETRAAMLGLDSSVRRGLVTELTVPVLLYRSAAPRLSARDLDSLLALAMDLTPDPGRLAQYLHPSRPHAMPERIIEDGYRRALMFREQFGVPEQVPLVGEWDLETVVLPRLGVRLVDLQLDDGHVEGVAVKAPGRQPTIAINRSGRYASTKVGRRMTLAHELCHHLLDADESGRVGVVSNPWAPHTLEVRAASFAAMLLMPEAAIAHQLARDSRRWQAKDLCAAMDHLGVGKSTFTWHLHNLRWITEAEQASWLDAL